MFTATSRKMCWRERASGFARTHLRFLPNSEAVGGKSGPLRADKHVPSPCPLRPEKGGVSIPRPGVSRVKLELRSRRDPWAHLSFLQLDWQIGAVLPHPSSLPLGEGATVGTARTANRPLANACGRMFSLSRWARGPDCPRLGQMGRAAWHGNLPLGRRGGSSELGGSGGSGAVPVPAGQWPVGTGW